ncbi:hypothetical protein ANN_13180 [Periplaneta americana]|uniref:HTH psq-type domain-containing protein n=1 Tax=Periplaneta americana TaxID=6978 RepID=A0ABQ8TIP3_PERAM|nr:hypothetical protein ANN_13180 [Periplaneta americana]
MNGKLSIRKASEQFAVPYTTLNNKLNNKYTNKVWAPKALSDNEEKYLVEDLMQCANWGFPLKKVDVRDVVQDYLNRKGRVEKRFMNNRPGNEWLYGFLTRNKELSSRMSKSTKRSREAITRETMNRFFHNLEETLNGVQPSNLKNCDETNFCDDPGQSKVIVKRGFKKSGDVPLCPEKVLSQIPDSETGNESDEREKSWTDSFVKHLKEARYGNSNAKQIRRGKRLNVAKQ